MPGELKGDSVFVLDQAEASQIYNKGFYGYPQKGGALELDLLEAIYLVEADRMVVLLEEVKQDLKGLIQKAVSSHPDFHIHYSVYRDLRQRGYIVKLDGGEFNFRIFPRGGNPSNSQTKSWVLAVSERSTFNILKMLTQAGLSERTRKELLLAVVDEEGDITYYEAERAEPKGLMVPVQIDGTVEGMLVEDSVLILNEAEADALYKEGFYGKKIGRYLQISLIEAAYLIDAGRLTLISISGKGMKSAAFLKRARAVQPDFDLRLTAFKDLRGRQMVVKTGFKYGTHFRVYEGDPGHHHSKYLVHAVPGDYATIWAEISRAIRLAHGVKKEILFGKVTKEGVEYARMKRVRP